MFFNFRNTDVGQGSSIVLFADFCLNLIEIDRADIFIGEVSEVIEQLLMRTKDGFAAIKLVPFCFDFVLRSKDIVHMPNLAINGELMDIELILLVEKVKFSHIIDYLPQEIAVARDLALIEDIFQHNFVFFIEPYLKYHQLRVLKQCDKVVLYYWDQFR